MKTKHFAAMAASAALLSMAGGCTDRLEDAGIPVGCHLSASARSRG